METQSDGNMDKAFNPLAAAEALEQSGMDTRQARACAEQMHLAALAGAPVTRPELAAELAKLKTDLLERMAGTEQRLTARIVESIAESERRMAALLWRLFGGLVALAGLAVAASRLLS